MSVVTAATKEQWEALVVESRFWKRSRQGPPGGNPVFDRIDQETIIEDYLNEFRELNGFRGSVSDLSSMNNPMARFYRLLYTDEFLEFRSQTLSEKRGASSLSRGVTELVIDQTFRYFVLVEASRTNAKRFAQLVVGVAVFRNTFDESSMSFLKDSLRKTNRRIFNNKPLAFPSLSTEREEGIEEEEEEEEEYEQFEGEDFFISLPKPIVEMLRKNRSEVGLVDGILNPSFGSISMKNLGPVFNASTSVFNPHRGIILHILHLLAIYASPEETLEILYSGSMEDFVKKGIKDILPQAITFQAYPKNASKTEIMANRTAGVPFILILDQESDLVPGGKIGNDSSLMQQIAFLRTLPSELVKAVSLTFRVPTSINIEGDSFRFCEGVILQTPWKNPRDERMRLVWEPVDEIDHVYSVRQTYNMRAFQDNVVRPLYKFSPFELDTTDRPFGLIDGEFDSELEKVILRGFYSLFPNGNKTWVELVDSEEAEKEFGILSSTRLLMFQKNIQLYDVVEFHDKILDTHLSDPSSPLFDQASIIFRGGLFPTINYPESPLTRAIELVFGGNDEEKVLSIYDNYLEFKKRRDDLVRELELKEIFPGEPRKDNILPIIKDQSPKHYREIIKSEPMADTVTSGIRTRDIFWDSDRGRPINIIQLGDTLGNSLEYLVYNAFQNNKVEKIYTFGEIDMKSVWSLIFHLDVSFERVKGIPAALNIAKRLKNPFVIVTGFIPETSPQLRETMEVALKEMTNLELFRGTVIQSNESVSFVPGLNTPTSRFFKSMERINRAKNCLVLGGEYEDMEFLLAKSPVLQRLHVISETDSGAKRSQEKITQTKFPRRVITRIFVQNDLTRNFVSPVSGQRYDLILCGPYLMSRFFETKESISRFTRSLSEELLSPNGRLHSLILPLDEIKRIQMSSELSENRMMKKAYVKETEMEFQFPVEFNLDSMTAFSIPFKINSRQFHAPETYDLDSMVTGLRTKIQNAPDLPPFKFLLVERSAGEDDEGEEIERAYRGVAVDVGKKVREVNNFVKRLLIEDVKDKRRVLDLACGHGQDLGKWLVPEYGVESYIGFDLSEKAIAEGRKRFKSYDYKPRFFRMDTQPIFGEVSSWSMEAEGYSRNGGYTVVSCQLALHYGLKTESGIKTFLHHVSGLMDMGGEFIVTTLDREEIARRTVDAMSSQINEHEVVLSGEHYRLTMEPETAELLVKGGIVEAGVGYKFLQFPGDVASRETTEYIVDHRYLQGLANEVGLTMELKENFGNYKSESSELKTMIEGLTDSERDIMKLYSVYRFRKTSEVRDVKPSGEKPFIVNEYVKRKQTVEQLLSRLEVSEAEPSFKRGLILLPEEMNVQLYLKEHDYETLHMVTESVGSIETIFDDLRKNDHLNDRQRVFVRQSALSYNPLSKDYEYIHLSHSASSGLTRERFHHILQLLSEGGSLQGTFVDREFVERLFRTGPMVEDRFANSLFSVELVDGGKRYILDDKYMDFIDIPTLERFCEEMGCTISTHGPIRSSGSEITDLQRTYLGIFHTFQIRKGRTGVRAKPTGVREREVTEEEIPEGSIGEVDRFVLVPRPLKKNAGTAAGESIRAESKKAYTRLNKDNYWRAKLSDSFEGTPIRMETGERFKSVSQAVTYFKCEFESSDPKKAESLEGYRGLNLESGLPFPETMKPLTKAVLGKRGKEWKEREQRVLERIYTAKFTNTGGQEVENPSDLSPLKILLLTQSAQLYSDTKTRNELLEEIRKRIRVVYGNI